MLPRGEREWSLGASEHASPQNLQPLKSRLRGKAGTRGGLGRLHITQEARSTQAMASGTPGENLVHPKTTYLGK